MRRGLITDSDTSMVSRSAAYLSVSDGKNIEGSGAIRFVSNKSSISI